MDRKLLSILVVLVVIGAVFLRSGRRTGECAPTAAKQPAAAIEDTPGNRQAQAEKLAAIYPLAEFGSDLAERAAGVTGRDVAEEARAKLRSRFTEKEFAETRSEFLVQNFTAGELAKLAEIYATPEGRSLMNKLPAYDEDWKKFLTPVLLETLSNAPEK